MDELQIVREGGAQTSMEEPIGRSEISRLNVILQKYKAGKRVLDRRVKDAERWWKLRNAFQESKVTDPKNGGFRAESAWLHNVIMSKHADAVEAYPAPSILPRGEEDRAQAEALSKIVPIVLRQNDFEQVYDEAAWQKLKTGTGVYKVIWDAKKLNGLGDISVTRRSLLNLFWEPGVGDIQDSRYVFDIDLVDREVLRKQYPELEKADPGTVRNAERMPTDDRVPLEDKAELIDCYYKKDGRLHYVKYAGSTVLYATENDPEKKETGLYEHGMYPYVFDVLYPVEGSPAGYGYVDVCANAQTRIDLLNTALLRNTLSGATPRYFIRAEGGINEEEFLNLENTLVHCGGTLNEENIRGVSSTQLSGNHISVLINTVDELRQTSGNTETSTGNISSGVTAAAAIAALQEAAGKGSRASIRASYRAYAKVVELVIELIRQFYDVPRQFRITGDMGRMKFVRFSNALMKPQWQGEYGGVDLGYRLPVYDIDIVPEKQNTYSKLAQNEMALEFFRAGLFNPALCDQASACVEMMDFDGKGTVQEGIVMRGRKYLERNILQNTKPQSSEASAVLRGEGTEHR